MNETTDNAGVSLDADAILAAVERGDDPSQLQAQPVQTEAPAPAQSFEKKFNWNGQEVVVNDPAKYDKWAQQGYDYAQKMAELKAQRESWEGEFKAKQGQFQEQFDTYRQIDDFARQNPEWWQHVQGQWQNRETPQLDPGIRQYLEPLQKELQGLKSFMNEYQTKQLEAKAAAEDAALREEITGVGKRFPEVDFTAKDANGQSLELAVIRHAEAKGIPSFQAAFLDYYQGHLEKLYESRGRSAVEKEMQARKQSGLLGQTPAPQKGLQRPASVKSRSYGDLAAEALAELGLQ